MKEKTGVSLMAVRERERERAILYKIRIALIEMYIINEIANKPEKSGLYCYFFVTHNSH